MYGDQSADYNWWYDYTTPEHMTYEHRYTDQLRTNLGDSMWIVMECLEIISTLTSFGLT